MNAAELLATVHERGAIARREIGDDGTAVLVVAPREAIGDLLPELARFKPALLELLSPDVAAATDEDARNRVRPELAQRMNARDVIALGRLLLKLDAGEEIETL